MRQKRVKTQGSPVNPLKTSQLTTFCSDLPQHMCVCVFCKQSMQHTKTRCVSARKACSTQNTQLHLHRGHRCACNQPYALPAIQTSMVTGAKITVTGLHHHHSVLPDALSHPLSNLHVYQNPPSRCSTGAAQECASNTPNPRITTSTLHNTRTGMCAHTAAADIITPSQSTSHLHNTRS